MERYLFPSKVRRGICFSIDALIVFGLGFLMAFLIERFSGFSDYFNSTREAGANSVFSDPTSSIAIEYIKLIIFDILINAGSYLVIIIIYLIIMPLFISWQTFGRLITKTRLLCRKTNKKPTVLRLIVREIVGEFLIYVLLTLILRFWNMFFFISIGYCFLQDVSIPDLISKTKIVKSVPTVEEEFKFEAEDYKYTDDYDWEADSNLEGEKTNEDATSEK